MQHTGGARQGRGAVRIRWGGRTRALGGRVFCTRLVCPKAAPGEHHLEGVAVLAKNASEKLLTPGGISTILINAVIFT